MAVFGPPGSGKSLLTRVLVDASHENCALLKWAGQGDLAAAVEDLCAKHVEVIFIDSVHTPEDVYAVYECGGVDVTGGAVIQVHATVAMPNEELDDWNQRRTAIEQVIYTYSLPYYTINNVHGDPAAPIAELARRAQIRK